MISSARLPIVALNTPPIAGLVCSATASVAALMTPDSGMMATALKRKTASGGAPVILARMAMGTKTSSAYRILISAPLSALQGLWTANAERARIARGSSPRSKQVAERNVHGGLSTLGGQSPEGARNIEDEAAALQPEPERGTGVSPPVMPDKTRAE